jgi:hypothetical protein
MGGVCRRDDNSCGKVQNVRGAPRLPYERLSPHEGLGNELIAAQDNINRHRRGQVPGAARQRASPLRAEVFAYDGLWGATKALTDGLKVAGIIRNDSPRDILQPVVRRENVEHLEDEHVETPISSAARSRARWRQIPARRALTSGAASSAM